MDEYMTDEIRAAIEGLGDDKAKVVMAMGGILTAPKVSVAAIHAMDILDYPGEKLGLIYHLMTLASGMPLAVAAATYHLSQKRLRDNDFPRRMGVDHSQSSVAKAMRMTPQEEARQVELGELLRKMDSSESMNKLFNEVLNGNDTKITKAVFFAKTIAAVQRGRLDELQAEHEKEVADGKADCDCCKGRGSEETIH